MIALKIKKEDRKKIAIIACLLCISCFLTYYFNIILEINIIFSHFFYLPAILACIWWKYKGILVSLFLAGVLLIIPFLMSYYSFLLENSLRSIILILIAIIIAVLSERISKADELQEAYDRINFYKDLFMHDMSNILQSIKSSSELYTIKKENVRNIDELDEFIRIINEYCLRGCVLISNVRTFSELDKEKTPIIIIEVSKVLNKSIEIIQKALQEREVMIEIKQEKNDLFVLANELLENVFDNIILNAIKHNNRRPIEIKIIISEVFVEGKNFLKIQFIDNGLGVEDERKEIIFEQRSSHQIGFERTGFGLSIVKRIIESYNGKIWVEDRNVEDHTHGSNFIIILPEAI